MIPSSEKQKTQHLNYYSGYFPPFSLLQYISVVQLKDQTAKSLESIYLNLSDKQTEVPESFTELAVVSSTAPYVRSELRLKGRCTSCSTSTDDHESLSIAVNLTTFLD